MRSDERPDRTGGDTGRPATFRSVLSIREFRDLYIVQTLSVAGDQLARIAVAWIVFARTQSALLTAVSYAVSYLPWIVGGPVLSVYADRLPRRQVMVVCDVLRAALVLVIAVPKLPTASLIVLVTLVSLLEPPFSAARAALVPEIVGEGDSYVAASTLGNSTNQLAVVVGFAVGGALVVLVGAHTTLVIDALSFALSAFVAYRFVAHRPAALTETSPWLTEVMEGAHVVFRDAKLRWLVVTSWIVVGTMVTAEAIAIPYAHAAGRGALTAGLLSAAVPLGMVVGALILGRAIRAETAERLMLPTALLAPATLAFTALHLSSRNLRSLVRRGRNERDDRGRKPRVCGRCALKSQRARIWHSCRRHIRITGRRHAPRRPTQRPRGPSTRGCGCRAARFRPDCHLLDRVRQLQAARGWVDTANIASTGRGHCNAGSGAPI